MPIEAFEPMSMLQLTAEIMEYQELLIMADVNKDPVLRLAYVSTAFIA
jgi:hypothetical protein